MKAKPVTLNDVAAYAGVSYQTVSRVLNQAPHVSDRTREKVEQAMTALHYIPNRVAQQLARRSATTIGLATIDLSLHAPSQIAAAIKTTASELGFNVVISMLRAVDGNDVQRAVNELLAQRVDGVIINVPLEQAAAEQIHQLCATTPALFLDTAPTANLPSVIFDPHQGTRLAIDHLVALGHRRIALLAGPQSSVSARLRYEGWQQALAAHLLTPCATAEGDWSASAGYQQAHLLLANSVRPTAIAVANDQMALGVLRAIHEYGLRVPEQISVIGFDDTRDSAYFQPPLTTIRQDFRQLGRESVNRLLECLQHPHTLAPLRLKTTLIPRQTTAAWQPYTLSPQDVAQQLITLARQLQR
ncbi:LacI family DNA-binding transcriptional regulator [Dickeya solani]|uniref:LacI family DNA-binding transcriptional regulator n=1 Tax=Dickeya solani TaxID=1089444 RepID=A0AAX4EYL6_9GAMM|nr:LacI family DNA-binding transcriptional regulator [Dickeya solani]MCA6998248.1 LacI family DNA-binding transcriptional regulator [Dickeya solani]MCZ0823363.1 LacI family DNA-binding transcriptional regulator [Dickeya solani]MDV6994147.1 LacI family DNA-binding transcriptional regulator [Dickeya solani]MDV7004255.1 LacI family DNA-binding transcriptional regulator [Dickeya solani]MDV7038328.1 LacI family DNA-binding transcriptional regulator [Dickeya solani]